jgi:protein-S-isoprenylcysteine O-methyltransferase Ste14
MSPSLVAKGIWGAWLLSWLAAALWSSRAKARAGLASELSHRVPTVAGAVLYIKPELLPGGLHLLWTPPPEVQWALVALIAAGMAFSWWARIHLGGLWSGSVTRKADHRVVDTGPYALVRHPIYTGVILGVAATAALIGTASALAGLALVVLGLWIKARLEERFLRAELGPDYDAYARRTGMLFPGLQPRASRFDRRSPPGLRHRIPSANRRAAGGPWIRPADGL